MNAAVREFRISVLGLERGMFVARLDRPWLGTGFPLEGVAVRTDEEVERLRRMCSYVYVDPARGRSPELRYVSLGEEPVVQRARGEEEIEALRHTRWNVTADFHEEAVRAETSHALLQQGVGEVMRDLQSGKKLDLQKLADGVDTMIESITRNPAAFPWIMELRRTCDYAYQHALGCSVWIATFGRHLGLDRDDLRELAIGGLLCDVGKVRLPQALLVKRGPLATSDVAQLRSHVDESVRIVESTEGITSRIVQMVAGHHERHDGSGYPHGLGALEIPIYARIAGLIDSFDAMTSVRPYAPSRSPHQAIMELYQSRDSLFQAELVEQFIRACGIYPTGSLVELSDGTVGVVMSVNAWRRLRPVVMLLLGADKLPLREFRRLDLGEVLIDDRGQPLNIRGGLPRGAHGIDPAALFLD
ncbi:HD-GYP domain-containing protein [Cognatilysobacter bugurensis]|uniref:Phosphodiesterase n=1 Tax=Cognatilysobacter bugurensis TaxID=543356 RepID=A0A918SVR9_9GAMM|nr:HD-GYP domain-containing protein [Lysobacter bugurensis]GHA73736.1 phosphodiesterase [Lysobacter bugurensis]